MERNKIYQEFIDEMDIAGFHVDTVIKDMDIPAVFCKTTKHIAEVSNYTKFRIALHGSPKLGWFLMPNCKGYLKHPHPRLDTTCFENG